MQLTVDEKTPVIVSKMSLVHTSASIQEHLPTDASVVESINETQVSHKESTEETTSNHTINDSNAENNSFSDNNEKNSNKEKKDEQCSVDSSEYVNNDEERCVYNNKDGSQIETISEETTQNPSVLEKSEKASIENYKDAAPKQQTDKELLDSTDDTNENISQKKQTDKEDLENTDNILPIINKPKLSEDFDRDMSLPGKIINDTNNVSSDEENNIELKLDDTITASLEKNSTTENKADSNAIDKDLNRKTKLETETTETENIEIKSDGLVEIKENNLDNAPIINAEETLSDHENLKESAKISDYLEVPDAIESNTLTLNNELHISSNSLFEEVDSAIDNAAIATTNDDETSSKESKNITSIKIYTENNAAEKDPQTKVHNIISDDGETDTVSTLKPPITKESSADESNLASCSDNIDKIESANNNEDDELSIDMEIDSTENSKETEKCVDNNCDAIKLSDELEDSNIDLSAELNKYDSSHSIHEDDTMEEEKKDLEVPSQASEDVSNNPDSNDKAETITTEEKKEDKIQSDVLVTNEPMELDKIVEASESCEKYTDKEIVQKLTVPEDKVTVSEDKVTVSEDKVTVSEDKVTVSEDNVTVSEDKVTNEVIEKASDNATNCCTEDTEKKPIEKKIQKTSMLANNLEIFSDEEDEILPLEKNVIDNVPTNPFESAKNKECVSLVDDDDDILVIDDDASTKNDEKLSEIEDLEKTKKINNETTESINSDGDSDIVFAAVNDKAESTLVTPQDESNKTENADETITRVHKEPDSKPLVANDFLNSFKTKMSEMTRADLEEFCVLKIVEGVIDRSNLSEIKAKLKLMMQNVEEWKKKAMVLNKQNRDLQIVMRTIQEEQKKKSDEAITPLKITRSVGMQVLMGDNKNDSGRPRNQKRYASAMAPPQRNTQKQPTKTLKTPIPVPKLVPAVSPTKPVTKPSPQVQNSTVTSNSGLVKPVIMNGIKPNAPVKTAEKRSFSDAIDLTDDEPAPPMKKPPVRLVPSQQLMAPGRSVMAPNSKNTSPRQVYIPIGSQSNIKPGQTLVFRGTVPSNRVRGPSNPSTVVRGATPNVRATARAQNKHPAPLPQAYSQPQPPNWKSLPPAPDLKISKIENGIVVSWKIDGYQESGYEEIVSYQLYAYQETSAPASTFLWNKIGDIKALPLPMACTLTQFIAGYKYYFAVRAVDIKSRIGPFSLPGSILLLNK